MKKYNKFDIDRVKSAADIRDFIPGLSGRGATQYCECPECHKSGRNKGFVSRIKPIWILRNASLAGSL